MITSKVAAALVIAVVLAAASALAEQPQSSVARVVYITTSKACACTLRRCQAGDAVVEQVFTGKRQGLLNRIDLARTGDEAKARAYIRSHRVFTVPALLMLDTEGKLLWSAQGEMVREEITKHLE